MKWMPKWVKNIWEDKPRKITPDQVMSDDPVMRDVVAKAWNTGEMVIATVDEDGNVDFTHTKLSDVDSNNDRVREGEVE